MAAMTRTTTIRILLLGAALIGFFGAASLSLRHLQTGEVCPILLFVPACYLVLAGYGSVIASVFVQHNWRTRFFFIGWTPVFGLALAGAGLHTFVGDTCPVNRGIPQCYISLGLALTILLLFLLSRKK
jgi:hypothetical protein